MNVLLLTFLIMFDSAVLHAEPKSSGDEKWISAKRDKSESFTQRAMREGRPFAPQEHLTKEAPVQDVAEQYLGFDPSDVPLWPVDETVAQQKLSEAFQQIRDQRVYVDPEKPEMQRRMAWLYPDDGCHIRAALFNQELIKLGLPPGWKIFAFGNLRIPTANHPDGDVLWWFHVAPIFRLKDGLYVADASLFPQGLVKLKQWLTFLAPDKSLMNLHMVTCDALAFNPHSRCIGGGPGMSNGALRAHNTEFLYYEWKRQERLGRDPLKVLGDFPPWISQFI